VANLVEPVNLPSARCDVPVALLNGALNVHGEMTQSVDFKCFSDIAKDEKNLHLNLTTAGADRTANIVQETKVASSSIPSLGIPVNGAAVESLGVEWVFRSVKAMPAGFRLNPYFSILADVAQLIGFRIYNRDLRTDRDHARVLQ